MLYELIYFCVTNIIYGHHELSTAIEFRSDEMMTSANDLSKVSVKNETDLKSIFCLKKVQKSILIFYLYFT